ncbi:MAG: zinc ribbon domain-containing protein [Schaedlerella sp.]|uniref:zinc ribbon domain-containing protein n=1 Tax=Schaedlerella sp. TaxID=2676057 RepID=UPI00352941A6
MRNFLEDLGKRLGETAESVTNKAGEAMEIQKLKSQIRTLERENDSDLAELGLAVYDQFKSGTEVGEEAAGLCEAIQSREESIAECLQKISDVKGDSQCEDCGKTVGKGMAYCPFCGHKMPEIVEEAAEDVAEAAEAVGEAAEAAAEKTEEAVEEAADAVAEKVGEAADAVAEKAEDIAEAAAEHAEEAKTEL